MTPEQTEQFRNECEARDILKMPLRERKPWLNSIGRVRGSQAQKYLEDEVKRQFKLERDQKK